MTELEEQLIRSLKNQEALLQQLIGSLNKPKLGLHGHAGLVYIYCNRSNGCLWYTLDSSRNPQPINETALTGYLRELRIEKVTRREKECWKLVAIVEADRMYHLECGHNSHFGKGLLSAIANLNPSNLKHPITIEVQPGTDDSVLFCRVWHNSFLIKATYGEDTKWNEVARKAMNNCAGVENAI